MRGWEYCRVCRVCRVGWTSRLAGDFFGLDNEKICVSFDVGSLLDRGLGPTVGSITFTKSCVSFRSKSVDHLVGPFLGLRGNTARFVTLRLARLQLQLVVSHLPGKGGCQFIAVRSVCLHALLFRIGEPGVVPHRHRVGRPPSLLVVKLQNCQNREKSSHQTQQRNGLTVPLAAAVVTQAPITTITPAHARPSSRRCPSIRSCRPTQLMSTSPTYVNGRRSPSGAAQAARCETRKC